MESTNERVVERDSKGRISKTQEGSLFFEYDSLGRQTGQYGNNMLPDDSTNYRFVVDFSNPDRMQVKEFYLEDLNLECRIVDSNDYYLRYFYIKDNRFTKYEFYNPIKDDAGNVIEHKLIEEGIDSYNPWYHELPDYLY